MTMPDITLNQAKQTVGVRNHRASDFLTEDEKEEVQKSNAKGNEKKANSFDAIDSYVAEIISRFGYDAYMSWKAGDISEMQMLKFVEAERARDARNRVILESVIVASVAGANNPTKSGQTPKSLKAAMNILKKEQALGGGK